MRIKNKKYDIISIIQFKNTICEDNYSGEKVTIEKKFMNYKKPEIEEVIETGPIYKFEFKNGECIKVISLNTGE